MILMIDNYDSFTYNLVQMFEGMGREVKVCRNDRLDLPAMERLKPLGLVVSPGPGSPRQAGVSVAAITLLAPRVPVLGICLGHQAIAESFGGKTVPAGRIVHGKTSRIFHDGRGIYEGLPNPFAATRYHSLIVERESLPDCLEISAWTEAGEVMGVRHRRYRVEGMQFHPESILTEAGGHLVGNFINAMEGGC